MNNILFNILENKFKESEEFRTLVYTDVFVHKLFYDLIYTIKIFLMNKLLHI